MKEAQFGEVTIGLGATPAVVLESDLLKAVSELPVGARLVVKRAPAVQLLSMLHAGEVDMFCGDITPIEAIEDRAKLEVTQLPPCPASFFCREGHPLLQGEKLTAKEMCRYPLASAKLSPFVLGWLQGRLQLDQSYAKYVSLESDNFDELIAIANCSDVVLLCSRAVVRATTRVNTLHEVPLDPPYDGTGRFGIVRLKETWLPPLADTIVNIIMSKFSG